MKSAAVVLTVCLLGVTLASADPARAARGPELPQLGPSPIPTSTPIFGLDAPPPSVASPDAVATCANDEFLGYRAVPAPLEREVTICGTVVAVPPEGTRGGPSARFAVNVDGTRPIPVVGTLAANPGDGVVVHGRYQRDRSGADWIDRITQTLARGWSQPGYVILNGTTYH
jgi:hypothetical protein